MFKRARVLVLLVFVAFGCGRGAPSRSTTPAAPSPALSYDGSWSGRIRYTTCQGERHCNFRIGTEESIVLMLLDTPSGYEGILVTPHMTADVSGSVDETGSLVLAGLTPWASERDYGGAIEVQRLVLSGRPGAELSGSVRWSVTPGPLSSFPEYLGVRRYDADVLSLARAGTPTRSYSGTWSGHYVIRNCTAVGWRDCYPYRAGELNDLVLTLVESGSTVTGQLGQYDAIQVSGELTGSGITLGGTSETRVSGGRSVRRVDTLDARIDRFGRLVGTMRFTDSYIKDAGGVLSTSYEADLWQVVSYRPDR